VVFDSNGQRIFTRKEVSYHNTATDAWLIIDKGVFNVTHWIPYHPGGEKKILNVCIEACVLISFFLFSVDWEGRFDRL
jgi:hypothetical protein